MLARKCDRCGSFYNHYEKIIDKRIHCANSIRFIFSKVDDSAFNSQKRFDLCPSCMKQLIKFIFMDTDDMEETEDVE